MRLERGTGGRGGFNAGREDRGGIHAPANWVDSEVRKCGPTSTIDNSQLQNSKDHWATKKGAAGTSSRGAYKEELLAVHGRKGESRHRRTSESQWKKYLS